MDKLESDILDTVEMTYALRYRDDMVGLKEAIKKKFETNIDSVFLIELNHLSGVCTAGTFFIVDDGFFEYEAATSGNGQKLRFCEKLKDPAEYSELALYMANDSNVCELNERIAVWKPTY